MSKRYTQIKLLADSPARATIIGAGETGIIQLLDMNNVSHSLRLGFHQTPIIGLEYFANCNLLVSATVDGQFIISKVSNSSREPVDTKFALVSDAATKKIEVRDSQIAKCFDLMLFELVGQLFKLQQISSEKVQSSQQEIED